MQEINIGNIPNDGTGDKLRDFATIVRDNFIELTPNYKEYVGTLNYSESDVTINEPLGIGRIYRIVTLSPGDNFSNVGYDGTGDYFTATGEYPISWNSSIIKVVSFEKSVKYNTFTNIDILPYRFEGDVVYTIISELSFSDQDTLLDGNVSFTYNGGRILLSNTSSIFQIKRYI